MSFAVTDGAAATTRGRPNGNNDQGQWPKDKGVAEGLLHALVKVRNQTPDGKEMDSTIDQLVQYIKTL